MSTQNHYEKTQIVDLTPDAQSDDWRDAEFKRYDVNLPAPTPAGRPLTQCNLIQRIRSIFLKWDSPKLKVTCTNSRMEHGFVVHSQTHPARAMQDTFYLENPEITH